MNTKYIPAVIMLLGGLVYCIVGIYNKDEFTWGYTLLLLLVLVIFYIIGSIAKAILDKYVPIPSEEEVEAETESNEDEEKELEDISETEESDSVQAEDEYL